MVAAICIPRMIVPDDFFIQDEQPWIDRSQTYSNAIFSGDFDAAVQYPLSNHPAITLMTVVGPVMNFYGSSHGLSGTYGDWPLDDKREAAVIARYVWGIVCSIALLLLYAVVKRMRIFSHAPWQAGLVVVLLGLEPWIWGISRSVSVDVLMAISVVGMLLSAVLAYEKRSIVWAALSGVWFAVAFVSKSPALITVPFAFLLAIWVPSWNWKAMGMRALHWIGFAYFSLIVLWPPFLFHPIARITDVLARVEMHSTIQEIYYWPGFHPPLFIFTLSAFATVGCLLYIWNRVGDIRTQGWKFAALDVVLFAGIWHGIILLLLHGDHARKNLPVLAILGCMGAIGWVWYLSRKKVSSWIVIVGLLILQGIFVWPYFPHVISSYNVLFPSAGGKRLLVDVGNGSKLVAVYINSHDEKEVYAVPMDSLIAPYLDADKRDSLRDLPSEGLLANLDPAITTLVIPASLPARIGFDAAGKKLLEELQNRPIQATLSVRDVPLFYIYSVNPIEYTTNHE